MIRVLRAAHANDRKPASAVIERMQQLAERIFQNGQPPCAGWQHLDTLAHETGPDEPAQVNTLLENIELLQIYEILGTEVVDQAPPSPRKRRTEKYQASKRGFGKGVAMPKKNRKKGRKRPTK